MSDPVPENLGKNLRQLRESRGLSQARIAEIAGIPRPTWTNLESGGANPTLSVLVKVADALHVRLEELLAAPRAVAKHYPAGTLAKRTRNRIVVRKLLPESVPGLDIERMELPPGARMTGTPHTVGTREYLTCESGTVQLAVAGTQWILEAGDVVVFRGDQKHGYHNPGRKKAVAYSVIAFAPVAG
jgi:transcriptional regulator with XRE-family HTH domain